MGEDEFAQWLPKMRDAYAQDIASNGGATEDDALRKAIADTERLFPGGQPSADQLVFVVEADGERVGELWLCERETCLGRGAAAMEGRRCCSQKRRHRRGLKVIGLNVFGGNEIARNLYRSLGYAENAAFMTKQI
jgi:hypothetical protein